MVRSKSRTATRVAFSLIGALLIGLVPVAAAHAGPLEPKKPSQLVTIRSSGRTCGAGPWRALDEQVNPDGTLSPFEIPPKMVFVVTSVDWRQGNTGGAYQSEEFFLFPSEANIGVNFPIARSLSLGSANSRAGGSFAVTGVAIEAGIPCWGVNNVANLNSASALVHGYLTKDR